MAAYDGYEPVIGLEVHAQLMTDSKIFCGCRVAYGEPPNSLTCPVCLGLPGSLPVLNKKAVECALRAIMAVGGTVRHRSVFARKNYFYPDLPKGYQISQYDEPLGEGGQIEHTLHGSRMKCGLIRIHLEEDAGKSLHPEHGEAYSRVDLNRCGTPLIEIVSQPEIGSPEEAHAYLSKLKQILQYTGVCWGDMEKGHLRCDANVSVRPAGQKEFGIRTEVKNMNSFRGVERALTYEIERQVELLRSGRPVAQATLLWDDKRQVAQEMRSKEESHDYRYFPEPDLVNLVVSDEWIDTARRELPELPDARAERFVKQYGIREYDAGVLTASRPLADYYEEVMRHLGDSQAAANWIETEVLGYLKEAGIEISDYGVSPEMLADLLGKVRSGEISGKTAKAVFSDMNATGKAAAEIIQEKGLAQISDSASLVSAVETVLSENPDAVSRYKAGKPALLGFFVGEVMKATGGKANPGLVNRLLKEKLGG